MKSNVAMKHLMDQLRCCLPEVEPEVHAEKFKVVIDNDNTKITIKGVESSYPVAKGDHPVSFYLHFQLE